MYQAIKCLGFPIQYHIVYNSKLTHSTQKRWIIFWPHNLLRTVGKYEFYFDIKIIKSLKEKNGMFSFKLRPEVGLTITSNVQYRHENNKTHVRCTLLKSFLKVTFDCVCFMTRCNIVLMFASHSTLFREVVKDC